MLRFLPRLVRPLCVVALASAGIACAQRPGRRDVVTLGSADHVAPSAALWLDRTGRATIRDVTGGAPADSFVPTEALRPTLGFTTAALWVRFTIRRPVHQADDWLMIVGREWTRRAVLYVPDSVGRYRSFATGTALPFRDRAVPAELPAVPVLVPRGSERTMYVRLTTPGTMTFTGRLVRADEFRDRQPVALLFVGSYCAVLLVMALYHLFLGITLRDASHLWLAATLGCVLGVELVFHGTWQRFSATALDPRSATFLVGGVSLGFTGLTRHFLETRRFEPTLDRLLLVGGGLAGLAALTWFVSERSLGAAFGAAFVVPPLAVAAAVARWRKGFRSALPFMLAVAAYALPASLVGLFVFGLFPAHDWVEPAAHVGMLLMTVLFSIAIGDRLARAREALTASADARSREAVALADELRGQVADRSRQLATLLTTLSATDEIEPPSLGPGDQVDGRYTVVREIASGGMGAVHLVTRAGDDRPLAMKVLTGAGNVSGLARLAREAQVAAGVRHPALVALHDIVATERGLHLIMEYVDGWSLEQLRDRYGDTGWGLHVLAQVAEGLAALHQHGVVHRDLKPANVLLTRDEPPRARITDFGISRLLDGRSTPGPDGGASATAPADASGTHAAVAMRSPSLTRTGTLVGTPLYMAPELGAGSAHATAASDAWAFGVMAHEILTGDYPFTRVPVFTMPHALPAMLPPRLARVPVAVADALHACLALEPGNRPTAHALAGALAGAGAPPTPPRS